MAVKLDFLQTQAPRNDTPIDVSFIYKDLLLDLRIDYTRSPELLKTQEVSDVTAIYDYRSVAQSLNNLFRTLPGQKILNPVYGLDLRKYLFENVSTTVGYIIGLELNDLIPIFEPRVYITKINVAADAENNQYNIDIAYIVPTLQVASDNKMEKLSVSLTQTGFTII
jgi:phage baseplate assembly protein W